MRLGNAFRKGYNEAVDTSRRRRSENAELFNNFVKMNADMGAKVSTQDLANYRSALSGGNTYFGAGLPSTGALEETSKRLGQIQANKQTVAAGNALGNVLTQLEIAKELAAPFTTTNFTDKKDEKTGKIIKGGLKEYSQFRDSLASANIPDGMFGRGWFNNQVRLNQSEYRLNYARLNNFANLKTEDAWTAAETAAPDFLKAWVASQKTTDVSRRQLAAHENAKTLTLAAIPNLISDKRFTDVESFKTAVEAFYKNSFTNGYAPDPSSNQLSDLLADAEEQFKSGISVLQRDAIAAVEADLSISFADKTDAEITALAKAYFARNGLGVPSPEQVTAYRTAQEAANKPEREQTAQEQVNNIIAGFTSSLKSGATVMSKYHSAEDKTKFVDDLLASTNNNYDILGADIKERHRAQILSAVTFGYEEASYQLEEKAIAEFIEFVTQRDSELSDIFKTPNVTERKELTFDLLNEYRNMHGLDKYTVTGTEEKGDIKYDEAFEEIYRMLDTRGATAHAINYQAQYDKTFERVAADITNQRDWWTGKNVEQNLMSIAPGANDEAKLLRQVMLAFGGTAYIPEAQRTQAVAVMSQVMKDLNITSESGPVEINEAVAMAMNTMGLASSSETNVNIVADRLARRSMNGTPPPGTLYEEYQKLAAGDITSLIKQLLQKNILNLDVTTLPKTVKLARDELNEELEDVILSYVEGLEEDEVRWSLDGEPNLTTASDEMNALLSELKEQITNAKPQVAPSWMTAVRDQNNKKLYALMTDTAIGNGKLVNDSEGEPLDATYYYELVDGALVKRDELSQEHAIENGTQRRRQDRNNNSDTDGSSTGGSGGNGRGRNTPRQFQPIVETILNMLPDISADSEFLTDNPPTVTTDAANNRTIREEKAQITSQVQAVMQDSDAVSSLTQMLFDARADLEDQDDYDMIRSQESWETVIIPQVVSSFLRSQGLPDTDYSRQLTLGILGQQ